MKTILLQNGDDQEDQIEILLEDKVPQPDFDHDGSDENFILGKDEETIWTNITLHFNKCSRVTGRILFSNLPGAKEDARNTDSKVSFFSPL